MSLDVKDLNRKLRATLWPDLRARGFKERTERVAWRYAGDAIDVVELQAVGQHAEAVGCPPLSLSAYVASYPPFLRPAPSIPERDGRPRPHYWDCDPFRRSMRKTIAQPWFRPFSEPRDRRTLPSFRKHREALSRLIDRAPHDRPDIWYVRDDGSNLDENLQDLTTVVLSSGMDLLDTFHDPKATLVMIRAGTLLRCGLTASPRAHRVHRGLSGRRLGSPARPDPPTERSAGAFDRPDPFADLLDRGRRESPPRQLLAGRRSKSCQLVTDRPDRTRSHAQLLDAESDQQRDHLRVGRSLAAHRDVPAASPRRRHDRRQQAQHSRLERRGQLRQGRVDRDPPRACTGPGRWSRC